MNRSEEAAMRKSAWIGLPLVVALGLASAGCHQGEVKLYKTRNQRQTVWMQKLDPDVFKDREKRLEFSVKAATIANAVSLSPGIALVNKYKANWDANVQAVLARYELLVNDHNSAHISLEEYWERRAELDDMFVTMAYQKPLVQNTMNEFYEYWKVQADEAFADLDDELKKQTAKAAEAKQEQLKYEMDELNKRLEDLNRKLGKAP
jgi:hypothetical protein